mgnify:FL=1
MTERTQETAQFRLHPRPAIDASVKKALLARGTLAVGLRMLLTREKYLRSGLVSVVLPFHDVRNYLRAALESLRYQRYFDLEVIMVDDGSTDGSAAIAEEFAARDRRFRLLRSENRGLGAARNLGAARANGRYLMFVDSDDVVPVGAIYHYVSSLEESGSAFVVGAVDRIRGDDRWRLGWVDEVHSQPRLATNLAEWPGVLHNVFAWNKLFRRDFFESQVVGFPEGVLYEDQLPIARAYVTADRFDVLAQTTYLWRERVGGGSITQRRGDRKNLADRVTAFEQVGQLLADRAPENAYRLWLHKSVFDDLRPFMVASLGADAAYRKELRRVTAALWDQLPESDRFDDRKHHDAAVRAVLAGDFDGLAVWLA